MAATTERKHFLATSEVSAAMEWNHVEENRRLRHRQVARLKAKQRMVDINEWAGRNSSSAKLQATVKKALRDWFEAARNGSEGVPCAVLVDAVITLGLNHDLKQVKRTVSSATDTNGQLRTVKSFTAALLGCCSGDFARERLFRSLRGEDEWRRFGIDGGNNESHPKVSASANDATPSGVPAFLTQLIAYRRKLLMATVADKFPTPCMSACWTPDCETSKKPGAPLSEAFEVCSTGEGRSSPTTATRDPACAGSGCAGRLVEYQGSGNARLPGDALTSPRACGLRDDDRHADSAISPAESLSNEAARPASVEARKRYRAVTEAFFVAEDRGQLQRLASTLEEHPGSPEGDPQQQQARRVQTPPHGGGVGSDRTRASPSGMIWMASPNKRYPEQIDMDGEVVRDTSGRLRDSMAQKEEHLSRVEARWDDYKVMKKRWRRRTPGSILMDDRMDEADRLYSRVSRPATHEGSGSIHAGSGVSGSVNSSRVCSASTCRRPSTAPAGTIADGSSWRLTTLGTSSVITGGSITCGRRCWQERALPLGPIPLDEGRRLRYPLLQLEREKIRTAIAASAARGDARSAARVNCNNQGGGEGTDSHPCLHHYVHIPVTRDGKGRWDPRLVKIRCGPQP